jgi:hypothetical protein
LLGTLERQSICVSGAVQIEIQTAIMETIIHEILSVSKSVALYPIGGQAYPG